MKKFIIVLQLFLFQTCFSTGEDMDLTIQQYTLPNGLTVLVKPSHMVPKVSIQLFYNVGSKDEKTGEKGIAHLIEHMIFKGTKKMLSESDIKVIVHMLSGSCNAFTSYDYTGYKFNMPSQNWREVFPIMADCMVNAAFADDHLNSEMKAVIQELKMIKDQYNRALVFDLLTTVFSDHPYHYPLIGYKQDLWSVSGKDLEAFYKKHYHPNNAVLVVVGDVDPQEVFQLAEKYFGHIPASQSYTKEEFYHNQDIAAKSITLYRDIQQPIGVTAFVIPGVRSKTAHVSDVMSVILGSGRSSVLYKKLVEQEQLVTSLSANSVDLFDYGLFCIMYTPKNVNDIDKINQIILDMVGDMAQHGISADEVQIALKKAKVAEYALLEHTDMQAYLIGQYYLATGDPNYVFSYLNVPQDELRQELQSFLQHYFRPSVMHKGLVLPLIEQDKSSWLELQKESDEQDRAILSARERLTPIELPRYAAKVTVGNLVDFNFPKAEYIKLANDVKVLSYANSQTPKISLFIHFKAKSWVDPQEKQGLYNFVTRMMREGTTKYTAEQLSQEIESLGITLEAYPGGISVSMLRNDFEKALYFLAEILTQATFPEDKINKVRAQIWGSLKQFWDNPMMFASQLMNEALYKHHPYSKNVLGTFESLEQITRDDLVTFYRDYISPDGATVVVVGDIEGLNIKDTLEHTLGTWQGSKVADLVFPQLQPIQHEILNFPVNRDQIVLVFAGLSIDRCHPDYDKLLLFDQIFGGAGLHSRLMQLREQSGLFYTIQGSTIAQSGKQPGMVFVKTLVSLDRLKEAEDAITGLINTVADTITEQELIEARNALTNGLIGFFDSNNNIAQAFLFLEEYELAQDYFDHRAKQLAGISLEETKIAAKKYLDTHRMCLLRIGRLDS